MVRRRWPDVLLVVGFLAVLATGIWALWGEDLRHWLSPGSEDTEPAQHGGGLT